METLRYKAFISYSHQDEKWARWLQRALESYRVPKRLAGKTGAFGPIPSRLRPVFRDREDLSSASDLSTEIKESLSQSDTLIVICSPDAAGSRWVNEEIRHFRSLPQGQLILALIVAGDPQESEGKNACFPPALRLDSAGNSVEPLAADARRYADGKHLARLKILAGVLGIRLDELRRRDAQRRLRKRIGSAVAGLAVSALIGWLAWSAFTTQAASDAQRAQTEELLAFMLGDLKQLNPIEGLELVPADDADHALLRTRLGFEASDTDQLMTQALEWRDKGLAHHDRGELEEAMREFLHSRAAIIELHQREGLTPRALFELGQAEFYVGLGHLGFGEIEPAQESWARYGALTRRLVNADPKNAKYVMELSYTLMNLGALEQSRPRPDSERSLRLIQTAIEYNQLALVLDPSNEVYQADRITAIAWLADAWSDRCGLGEALQFRQQGVDLRRAQLARNPEGATEMRELAFMLSGLAGVQQQIGLVDEAIASFDEAVGLMRRLHLLEPDNLFFEWEWLYRQARKARLMASAGRLEASSKLVYRMAPRIAEISDPSAGKDHLQAVDAAHFELDLARTQLATGRAREGREALRGALQRHRDLLAAKPEFRSVYAGLAHAYFENWQAFGEPPEGDYSLLMAVYLSAPDSLQSCSDAARGAMLAQATGDRALAQQYTDYVLGKGYYEPGFVTFCRRYGLCPDHQSITPVRAER